MMGTIPNSNNVHDDDYLRRDVGSHQSPEALLAYELNQMSFKERDEINEEVHGVRDRYDRVEETPELLSDSLHKLSLELNAIKHKPSYERSQAFARTWVNTQEFRLIFLRCALFNARKAASRMVAFLELLHEYFGEYALEREIYLSDFDEKDMQFLNAGYYQLLPGRDRSGRRILGNFSGDITEYTKEMRIKAVLYIVLRMVKDDIDTQRKGAILLFWMHEIRIDDFKTRSYVHKKLVPALPLRASAFHLFLPSDIIGNERLMQLGKAMYMLAIGAELRQRLRVHSGMFLCARVWVCLKTVPSAPYSFIAVFTHSQRSYSF